MTVLLIALGVALLLLGTAAMALTLLSWVLPRWGGGGPTSLDLALGFVLGGGLFFAGLFLVIAN